VLLSFLVLGGTRGRPFLVGSLGYTPSPGAYLHHIWLGMRRSGMTGLRSLEAESLNRPKARTEMAPAATPVFLFQWTGLFHHPPAGDQT
jgi:hypothetical protein